MIAFAEAATTTEIRTETTRAVLFEDAVDPALVQFEPPRVSWRLFGLSHAAIATGLARCR